MNFMHLLNQPYGYYCLLYLIWAQRALYEEDCNTEFTQKALVQFNLVYL